MARPSKECKRRVHEHIRQHFPDMADVKPAVSCLKSGGQTRHRFTFRKALRSSDGEKYKQIVHVTADQDGKVLKVAVSR